MQGSFQRVIDQFAPVQKAMGDVQAVTGQIGDLKRIFSNVKKRGGWGEAQLRALLEDHMPEGGWEANRKLRDDSDEVVEFVLVMPARGRCGRCWRWTRSSRWRTTTGCCCRPRPGMRTASARRGKGLEARLRPEARKIADKYIVPPRDGGLRRHVPADGRAVRGGRARCRV